jgi:hypothetical protein
LKDYFPQLVFKESLIKQNYYKTNLSSIKMIKKGKAAASSKNEDEGEKKIKNTKGPKRRAVSKD